MHFSQQRHYSGSQMNGPAPTLMLLMFLHIFKLQGVGEINRKTGNLSY